MQGNRRLWFVCASVLAVFAWTVSSFAAESTSERKGLYNEKADAKADIAAALSRASQENHRVLLVWGGNWCSWCIKLHGLFQDDRTIKELLKDEYQVVLVDINHNKPLAEKYKVESGKGVPYLTLLDSTGKVIVNQETGSLEAGSKHDPEKVLAFLKKNKAEPVDANELINRAKERAAKEGKSIFVRLGAPWCGWCHKLDDYIYQPDVMAVLEKHFVLVKVDMDRARNAKSVAGELGGGSNGIPWFTMLDAEGKKLITSDGSEGNIGYPTTDADFAHFRSMLTKAGKKITPTEVDKLITVLKEHGKKKKAG